MNRLNHVAFIMDGNGRWGKKKNRGRNYGHLKGVDVVKKIVTCSIKLKIPVVTFYVFSSENWKRPKSEISFLFKLISNYFNQEIENVASQGIKINIIGDVNKLSSNIKKTLKTSSALTKKNKKIIVNLAINYGSKNEILNTLKKVKNNLSINNFEKNLYTKNMPNPDILIRTGGHQRLSNFMLWQLAYAELFFLNKLWPDFKSGDLIKIIDKYKKSKRNFGAI
jgi:undecaprenyl diphosphate synthase